MSKVIEFTNQIDLVAAKTKGSFHEELVKKLKKKDGEHLYQSFIQMMEETEGYAAQTAFYTELFGDLEKAITFYSLMDGDYYKQAMEYIENNAAHLGHKIVIDGDLAGYMSILVAMLKPDADIYTVSFAPVFPEYFSKLKDKFEVKNIRLIETKLADNGESFDTIIALRKSYEYLRLLDMRRYAFAPIQVQCHMQAQRYIDYAEVMTGHLRENGHIFAFEYGKDSVIAGYLLAMNGANLVPFDCEHMNIVYPEGERSVTAIHLETGEPLSFQDVMTFWKNYYTDGIVISSAKVDGTMADILLEDFHAECITGYYFLQGDLMAGKIGLYRNRVDATQLLFYAGFIDKKEITLYSDTALEGLTQMIEDYKTKNENQVKCVKIKMDGFDELSPFQEA